MTNSIDNHEKSGQITKCSVCRSYTTYIDKTNPRWRYEPSGKPICGKCYARAMWKKRIPVGVRCDRCKSSKTSASRYGQPRWVRTSRGGYLCWSCHIVRNNTGRIFSHERKKNISMAIRRALASGAIMGPRVYTMDETVFDTITEESSYWIGNLMADGNIYTGKTGNPRIALTVAERDRKHLVKFTKFLKCSNRIMPKITKVNGKAWVQYTLRFSSKRTANALMTYGVTAKKSLTATVIGLENIRHFWRGVIDGDGYFKNRDGRDGDKIIVVGSYSLMVQLRDFITRNIPSSKITIKQDERIYRLYVYGYTARMLAELLYSNSLVALDRKLTKAQRMFSHTNISFFST
jgi:hypothetical protein